MWSNCCSLHVVIIVLVVGVLICDIVNVPFLSVGVVVGVYIFLDDLFAAQPGENTCYLTHFRKKTYMSGCLSTTDSPHKASEQ